MSDHKYKLTYHAQRHPEGVTPEQVPAGHGACDAMLMASIIYPDDGSLSIMFISDDGRTDSDLADSEWFKVWTLLASRLSKSTTLGEGRRGIARITFEAIARAIRDGK